MVNVISRRNLFYIKIVSCFFSCICRRTTEVSCFVQPQLNHQFSSTRSRIGKQRHDDGSSVFQLFFSQNNKNDDDDRNNVYSKKTGGTWIQDTSTMSKKEQVETEEARIKILNSRRNQIRGTLRAAETLRNFRINNGYVPELDESTGKPKVSDSKLAISLTAFVVAGGAIALRIGGRAALLSVVGLDFLSDSPELKENLDNVLQTADNMNVFVKLLSFTAAWTAIKVLCFDAGGVVLALASGILFGGVVQGAVVSAAAATFGSLTAFTLAKVDTPFRKKALELLEEYPSLRGIDKVVAKDGLRAVLTLRIAPVLPIPIGLYNYIYGVTNVPIPAFLGGIFLGSLKPYFLDSYLGYFGKDIVQGNADPSGLQDILLLGALGVSVLIGVFASQLAAETWDTVLAEVEEEKKTKNLLNGTDTTEMEGDGIIREVFGAQLPEWIVGFQLGIKDADKHVTDLMLTEYQSKVWNYTNTENGESIPLERNPANFAGSPEIEGYNLGIDLGASLCEGLVLSPIMFTAFLRYSDPLYNEVDDELLQNLPKPRIVLDGPEAERRRKALMNKMNQLRMSTEKKS